ncbi:MAG: cobalamin B12-binding domain-containing protein, partial [Syntrophomonas sp.]
MKVLLCTLNAKFIHSSLALRYLRAACDQVKDLEICLSEFTINEPLSAIMAEIYRECPDVLCFSCYIWNIKQIIEVCQDYKKVSPLTPVVLGGPEVSFDSAELMNKHKFIDFVICG